MVKPAAIVWTRPALDSLLDIVRHIQTDNPHAAKRFAGQIKRRTLRLERFPDSGRLVPEFPASGLREIIEGNYRVIYRVAMQPDRVEIITVRHGARLLLAPPDEA